MGYTELTEKPHLFEQGLRGDHILGKLGKCLYTCENREAAAHCESLPFACWGISPNPIWIAEMFCGCAPFRRLFFLSLMLMGSRFLLIQIKQSLGVGLVNEQISFLLFELVVFSIICLLLSQQRGILLLQAPDSWQLFQP